MKTNLDVLLVHPNASKKIYQDLSKSFSAYEQPIWAGMIASYLNNKGYTANILDCEVNQLSDEESIQKIKDFSPKIVCLVVYGQQPSASAQNMHGAEKLMQSLKGLGMTRLYVGLAPSALPEFIISRDDEVLVCRGEGPKTIEALLQSKDSTDPTELEKVPGLWFYDWKKKEVKSAHIAPVIADLDNEIPTMSWDLMDMMKYRTANWHSWTNEVDPNNQNPFAALYTSLGCPYNCSFCCINAPFNDNGTIRNSFRHFSPQKIISFFDQIADFGITNVKIADELFVLKPAHFLETCKLIKDRGYKFNIWCYSRINTLKEEYVVPLKEAGVNWVGLGIESGNSKVRQEVTKGRFEEVHIQDVINKARNAGICVTGNYIFGLPTDTYETMEETLEEAMTTEIDYFNGYSCMAYPGSQLHREWSAKDPNCLPENTDAGWLGYSQHSYECYPLPTDKLKNWEVLKFRDEAFLKFFTNQEYLDRMISKFGDSFKNEMSRMLEITLPRKIVEENSKNI
tara:strand:- start:17060 stop:18592 length:1533 start_codon:yes stop_codon:yes gene_type:complete